MTTRHARFVGADRRLATYGTLAPGRINHHQVAGLAGEWTAGRVRGRLLDEGWGAALGCPGLILDPHGPTIPVEILTAADLPDHWARLDAFEGLATTPARTGQPST